MSTLRVALEALRWAAGGWLLWRIPRPRPAPGAEGAGSLDGVSVVVPARDEAESLPALLRSLAGQRPAPARVVVVDDHSTDGTSAVARAAGVDVVTAPPLPEGWTGKSWACWTGAETTSSPVLVFLDADTVVSPGGLARLASEQRSRGGLLSVQPFHLPVRASERLALFFNVVGMMGVGAFSPGRSRHPPSGAFGPAMVCRRDDYETVGGHRRVRGAVADDVALAAEFSRSGLPVACLGGRGTVSFRMYPRGLGQLVEGFSKNMATGAWRTRPLTLALVFAWVSGCIVASWSVRLGGVAGPALYAAYVTQLAWMARRIGRFGWWPVVLFPVPLAVFLVVFARSCLLTFVTGRVRWRGRTVVTR